jgi:putative ABC transport system permease protein
MHDLRYAFRALLRQRLFTATAVATLALGLGATTAMLTLVDAVWLDWSRSYRDASRLTMVYKSFRQGGSGPTTPHDFRDWQNALQSFDPLAAYVRSGARITTATEPIAVSVVATTHTFFPVLGVRPVLGRFYRPDEEQWGRHAVAVLSYGSWQTDFQGDRSVIGRKITVDDAPVEIIGVAPHGTWFGSNPPSLFMPLSFAPTDTRNSRNSHFVFALGRLRPGATLTAAQSEAALLANRITTANPGNQGTSIVLEPLEDVVLGDVRPTLRLLLGAVGLLLAIACANVANLMLVRGAARFREMAVRSALGASARRLARQLIAESVMLSFAGGLAGIVLAMVALQSAASHLPSNLPRIGERDLQIDWTVALLSMLVMLATGIVTGLLPALRLSRWASQRNADALREGSRGVAGGRRAATMRGALVVGQVAISMVLLVLSGLFVRSLTRLQRESTGVHGPESVLSLALPLPRSRTLDGATHARFFDDALRSVREVPGIVAAGVASNLPLTGGGESKSFWVEGQMPTSLAEVGSVVGRMESAHSLQAVGATLVHGRWFAESDRGNAPGVAIINESVARRFFGTENPIGRRISLHRPEAFTEPERLPAGGLWPRWTVIGVIRDVKYTSPRDEPERAVYVHYPQGLRVWSWGPRWLVVRSSGDPLRLAAPLRRAMRELDPSMPLGSLLPLDERMALSLRAPAFTAKLIGAFALVAVLLATVGLYGIIAYTVSLDTRSFGVRMALGATARDVSNHVIGRGLKLAATGLLVGIWGAFGVAKLTESQLFGISALDPLTYGMAGAGLFTLALIAGCVPAFRASKVSPSVALRSE